MPRPRTRRRSAALLGLVAVLAVSGCGAVTSAGEQLGAAGPAAAETGSPSARPSAAPACVPAPLPQRAAATLVVGLPGVTSPTDPLAQSVVDLGVGGVFLSHSNIATTPQVTELVAGLRARAARPLLVSTDEESGRVAVTRRIVGPGPSPRRLAAESTPAQVRAYARQMGDRLAAVGVDLDLAPVLDLDAGPSRGIVGDRSFSADPVRAAEYGLAFSAGLQDAGVRPTVKHFPGQGRSTADTHREPAVVPATVEELRSSDLLPFQRAVDAGVPVVMLNHLGYAALDGELPASLSPRAYDLLRSMGFRGVAITDSVGMGAVNLRWDFPEAAVAAVTAGADAVLATDGNQAVRMRDALVAAVQSGALPEARLSEAAARVTALAGGDPRAMSCLDIAVPRLEVPDGRVQAAGAPGPRVPAAGVTDAGVPGAGVAGPRVPGAAVAGPRVPAAAGPVPPAVAR